MATRRKVLTAIAVLILVAAATWTPNALAEAVGDLSTDPAYGVQMENDDIGATLFGAPQKLALAIGKSDVWDRRWPYSADENMNLGRLYAMADDGRLQDPNVGGPFQSYYQGYSRYDVPCPKPVGQAILLLPFAREIHGLSRNSGTGEVTLTVAGGADKSLDLTYFVHAGSNLIAIQGRGRNLVAGDVKVRLYRHRDTLRPGLKVNDGVGAGNVTPGGNSPFPAYVPLDKPTAACDSILCYVRQRFPAEPTFPQGFQVVMAAAPLQRAWPASPARTLQGGVGLGAAMTHAGEPDEPTWTDATYAAINAAWGQAATFPPGPDPNNFLVLITVTTTGDAIDPLAGARAALQNAMTQSYDMLHDQHTTIWNDFWARGLASIIGYDSTGNRLPPYLNVVVGGNPYRPTRRGDYHGDVPLISYRWFPSTMPASGRMALLAPQSPGKFAWQDSAPWHGAFTLDEVEVTGYLLASQLDLVDAYVDEIIRLLPMAQAHARNFFARQGAMYPVVHFPARRSDVFHANLSWEMSMELTALVAKPIWLRYLYTHDVAELERGYPVLREGAIFYASFLTRDQYGRYHVTPTQAPEHRPYFQPESRLWADSPSALSLIKYHLEAASAAAELLGRERPEVIANWRAVAGALASYPTRKDPVDGLIFADVAGAIADPPGYNIPVPLAASFWGDDIDLGSSAELVGILRNTVRHIDRFPELRPVDVGRARAMVGLGPRDPAAAPYAATTDNFIQSTHGILRVFPVVPAALGRVEMTRARAQGAFVVSGVWEGGAVRDGLTIESEAGEDCRLAAPWGSAGAHVHRRAEEADGTMGGAAEGATLASIDGDGLLPFRTVAGESYVVHRGPGAE
jgi:hypothetical protein